MHLHHLVYLHGKVAAGYVEKQQIQKQLEDAVVLCLEIFAGDLEIQMDLHYEVA